MAETRSSSKENKGQPAKAAAAPKAGPAAKQPQLKNILSPGKYTLLCWLGLPMAILMVAAGALGIIVVMDDTASKPISSTPFASGIRKLVSVNPVLLAALFNGGIIGVIGVFTTLRDHAAAVKLAGAAASGKKD